MKIGVYKVYLALYRKYRPKNFKEVVGQGSIIEVLINEIERDKVGHAYLFTGTRGTGKTSCAKILAKTVNCEKRILGEACNNCERCLNIEREKDLDIVEIDAASNNGVDNIREIKEEIEYHSRNGGKKVYIIDEVHMLSIGAFNALLKIMEEPPENILFILATTEEHKVPITIKSRCERFEFKRIKEKDITLKLEEIIKKEKLDIEEEGIQLISRMADGGMRDALSILDKVCSKEGKITKSYIEDICGIIDDEEIECLVKSVIVKDIEKYIEIKEDILLKGKDIDRILESILEYLRDIILYKNINNIEKRQELIKRNLENIKEIVENIENIDIIDLINEIGELYKKSKIISNKNIILDIIFINRIRLEEKKIKNDNIYSVDLKKSSDKIDICNSDELHIEDTENTNPFNWEEISKILREDYKGLYSILSKSEVQNIGEYIYIDSPNIFFRDLIKRDGNSARLIEIIKNYTGKRYKIRLKVSKVKQRYEEDKIEHDLVENIIDKANKLGIEVEIK